MTATEPQAAARMTTAAAATALPVLFALSLSHFLNDMMQQLVPAIYPIIKPAYGLDYGQIGLISFAFQICASMFQPVVGYYTDRNPKPFSLVIGMGCSLVGLVVLAYATAYVQLLIGAALVGTGSAIFHPEATRMVRLASGGRHGFAQAIFQVGGYAGSASGPLLAAFIVAPRGQGSLIWFALVAFLAMIFLSQIGLWYRRHVAARAKAKPAAAPATARKGVAFAVTIIVLLMFSKSAYSASLGSYYTFYLLGRFDISVQTSQMMLFVFLASQPVGTLIGGFVGDSVGRRQIIWFSILGALPFTLALPYVGLVGAGILTFLIGTIMASAFPALLIYAMDLLPGRLGLVAGVFYGLSFGFGGVSAALLGELADITSINFVFQLCSFLPMIGLLTWFLPEIAHKAK
jgi:FSR family fosmidomycin resistance protein-like MFS transporter